MRVSARLVDISRDGPGSQDRPGEVVNGFEVVEPEPEAFRSMPARPGVNANPSGPVAGSIPAAIGQLDPQGFLAERAFAKWLEEREVAFTWNGGADYKPDFVVFGLGVGCKARSFTST